MGHESRDIFGLERVFALSSLDCFTWNARKSYPAIWRRSCRCASQSRGAVRGGDRMRTRSSGQVVHCQPAPSGASSPVQSVLGWQWFQGWPDYAALHQRHMALEWWGFLRRHTTAMTRSAWFSPTENVKPTDRSAFLQHYFLQVDKFSMP